MAIPIEFFSVFIPLNIIETKYPGGLASYQTDCPNGSFLKDRELTRVGFMNDVELHQYCMGLIQLGFHFDTDSNTSNEFVVVQNIIGCKWKVDWLKIDENGYASFTSSLHY